jgi:hypothetical protein
MRTAKLLIIGLLVAVVAFVLCGSHWVQTLAAENPIVIGVPVEAESAEAAKHFHGIVSTATVAAVYPANNPLSLGRESRDPPCSFNSQGLSILPVWNLTTKAGPSNPNRGVTKIAEVSLLLPKGVPR